MENFFIQGVLIDNFISPEERDQERRMLVAIKDKLQTEFEKVPAQISQDYFKLTRDYLLLLCDLREMIELGYPIRLINDRAAQKSCRSKVPKVQKVPSEKPYRQDGPPSALDSINMTAEEYHDFLQWQKEKKKKETTVKDGVSQAAKAAVNQASTSKEEKPADAASEETNPFRARGLDGKV